MKIYGCLAAQSPDSVEEIIDIQGMELRPKALIDEHRGENPSFFHILGPITYYKKLFSEKDCENELQKRAWQRVQVPMAYIEGEIIDDTDHPNAKAAAELIRFLDSMDNPPFQVGLSVDGGILERRTHAGQPTESKEEGKYLAKTIALAGAVTIKPCNTKCFLSQVNDLQKSKWTGEPPKAYFEALQKSSTTSSFVNNPDLVLMYKLDSLKKSVHDFFTSFTSMQCKDCGHPVRFFKSSSDIPNKCEKCGEAFSISNLWKALNK